MKSTSPERTIKVVIDTNVLISGDPHLLEIKKFQEIRVVSPKEFLENFKTKL